MVAIDLTPDWQQTWTPKEAEEQLSGFKWKGPGIYKTGIDTMLVVPSEEVFGRTLWQCDNVQMEEKFQFIVYGGRDISLMIEVLCQAPIYRE